MAGLIKREDIDAVRERARIDELVGEHVTLKSAGAGSMKGLCPFHDERTPSFNVRPQLGLFHCFGCGEGGDVIAFIQKINHLSFTEAVEYLADRVGVELHYEDGASPARRAVEPGSRQRLLEANRVAETWFAEQLATPAARNGRRFLAQRGFDRQAAEHFGVGYAPSGWDNLARVLRSQGFTEAELVASGLCGQGGSGGGRIYDRFRDRLMWPIRDVTGATVGFGGRRLSEEDKTVPKYLNTPETAIYHKGQVLYGLDLAKAEIARGHRIVVVEGYTDVMAAHLSGVRTAVATCGTAFGSDHVRIVRRLLGDAADPSAGVIAGNTARGGEIVFTFDGDAAGRKAALRAYGEDQHFAAQTFVAVDPHGMDPCDLRMAEGDEAIPRLLARRVPLFEFVIRTSLADLDLDTAEGRVRGLRAAAPVVAGIRDRALKREYTRRLAGWLGMPETEVVGAVRGAERRGVRPGNVEDPGYPTGQESGAEPERPGLPRLADPVARLERQALEVIVQVPVLATEVGVEDISPEAFTLPVHRAAFEAIEAVGGAPAVPGLVARAQAAGMEPAEALQRATVHWIEEVRAGAIAAVDAAITELAVAPMPVSALRGDRRAEPSEEALRRYAAGVLSALARTGINRRLAELRAKQRRMSAEDPDYREVFEEIVGLENRRHQIAQRG